MIDADPPAGRVTTRPVTVPAPRHPGSTAPTGRPVPAPPHARRNCRARPHRPTCYRPAPPCRRRLDRRPRRRRRSAVGAGRAPGPHCGRRARSRNAPSTCSRRVPAAKGNDTPDRLHRRHPAPTARRARRLPRRRGATHRRQASPTRGPLQLSPTAGRRWHRHDHATSDDSAAPPSTRRTSRAAAARRAGLGVDFSGNDFQTGSLPSSEVIGLAAAIVSC